MKRRYLSPWLFDSDQDYYEQFNPQPEPEEPDDWEDERYDDGECEYWTSGCYGRG